MPLPESALAIQSFILLALTALYALYIRRTLRQAAPGGILLDAIDREANRIANEMKAEHEERLQRFLAGELHLWDISREDLAELIARDLVCVNDEYYENPDFWHDPANWE